MTSGTASKGTCGHHNSARSSMVRLFDNEPALSFVWIVVALQAGIMALFVLAVVVARVRLSEVALGLLAYLGCSAVGFYGVARIDARRRGFDALRERQRQEYKLRLIELRWHQPTEPPQAGTTKLSVVQSLEEQN